MAAAVPQPAVGFLRSLLCRLRASDLLRLATLLAIAAFLADWATKSWALDSLDGTMPLGSLLLGVERNEAFAFSSGRGAVPTALVIGVRLLMLAAVVWCSRRIGTHTPRSAAGIGLLLGGGSGNAADMVFRGGSVIDFIGAGPFRFDWAAESLHFHLFFNLADVAVLVGLGLLAPAIQRGALRLQQRIARWEERWLGDRVGT